MTSRSKGPDSIPAGAAKFGSTHWSMVLAAGGPDSPKARAAMEKLCAAYWYPLYAFVRGQGNTAHDAQDLTQEFFARFLEKRYLDQVDRSKGRFRSFLLVSLKHFLSNERDKAHAQKRGGGFVFVPLDPQDAETRYGLEPSHDETADKIFERRWALALLDQVLARLRDEYSSAGKAAIFDQLKGTLTGEESASYAEVAPALGMTEGAVKVAAHRMRQRYREILRAEVANTVARPDQVGEELRHLMAALSG